MGQLRTRVPGDGKPSCRPRSSARPVTAPPTKNGPHRDAGRSFVLLIWSG